MKRRSFFKFIGFSALISLLPKTKGIAKATITLNTRVRTAFDQEVLEAFSKKSSLVDTMARSLARKQDKAIIDAINKGSFK